MQISSRSPAGAEQEPAKDWFSSSAPPWQSISCLDLPLDWHSGSPLHTWQIALLLTIPECNQLISSPFEWRRFSLSFGLSKRSVSAPNADLSATARPSESAW